MARKTPAMAPLQTLLAASPKLSYNASRPEWFAWKHQMIGLFWLVDLETSQNGYYVCSRMAPSFHQAVNNNLNMLQAMEINWYPGLMGTDKHALLAQSMLVASISQDWMTDRDWEAHALHSNPRRLWMYLEQRCTRVDNGFK